ncbi:Phosphatidylinositol N-acetyglucosaminlytransferase subunit P-related [Zea mays]|uniref:Phosphatidylinositol N-acetyglucosaminlytransferase subunit P-related n=1 Tax=Zea mays TaxID=4577 RepID=A0A1D6E3J7_MAIZE|nr:Phosphatidylinositol N-acetyglucosaminlytransferase subunit P-related [Zea mays]
MFSAIMAKKNYKQHSKSEKIQGGCMSGLIRMLDFRRSPKLLSDGRVKRDKKGLDDIHGNISANNGKDHRVELIYVGRSSIRTLMEEEMASSTQPLKQAQSNVAGICSEDIDLNLAGSLMEIYRSHTEGQETRRSIESGRSSISTDEEKNTDPPAHHYQIPSSIQRALEDVAEAVIRHQSANKKYINSGDETRSREFVDALQLLSSNKELFVMLMQDPSSRLLECLQNLYMSLGSTRLDSEEYDEGTELQGTTDSLEQSATSPSKVKRRHNSFLKEDGLVTRKPPKLNDGSRGLSRIVILKPSPARGHSSLISGSATSSPLSNHIDWQVQEGSDKHDCHFSLRELKRRLRIAISNNQKDHQLNSTSSDIHEAEADSGKLLPVTSMSETESLASTDSSDRAKEPSIVDEKIVPEDSESGMRNDVAHGVGVSSFSYEKAKMYIIERLNDQGEESCQIVQKSESFERLISLPENGTFSPIDFPQEEKISIAHEATKPLNLHTVEQEDGSASPYSTMQYEETESADTSNLGTETLIEPTIDHGSYSQNEGAISQELVREGNLFILFVL